MRKSLVYLLAGAALIGPTGMAFAADKNYDAPPVYEAPVEQSVEFGTGWYIRGNLGFAHRATTTTSYNHVTSDELELDEPYSIEFGGGKRISDYVRADITTGFTHGFRQGERRGVSCGTWDHDSNPLTAVVPVVGDCSYNASSEGSSFDGMANVYLDLGEYGGFSPYVGIGGGASYLNWSGRSTQSFCEGVGSEDCQGQGAGIHELYAGTSQATGRWRPAYALMGGISYKASENLSFDLGYRYRNINGAVALLDNTEPGNSDFVTNLTHEDLKIHEVRVGVRYSLW